MPVFGFDSFCRHLLIRYEIFARVWKMAKPDTKADTKPYVCNASYLSDASCNPTKKVGAFWVQKRFNLPRFAEKLIVIARKGNRQNYLK